MRRIFFAVFIVSWIFFLKSAGAEYVSVDTFDDQAKPNNLGGDYGVWKINWEDPHQDCQMSYDRFEKVDKWGMALKIAYDVDSDAKAECGFFTVLGRGTDLRNYDRLIFYVKGDAKEGFTTQVEIEISSSVQTSVYLVTCISAEWQKKTIMLDNFKDIKDWSDINRVSLIIKDTTATEKKGVLYIDDIYFSDDEKVM